MKTIIAPANTQVFSFRHSTFNQREKMTTNEEWPKFKWSTEPEYPMWSTENQCRKRWPNDDYPKFPWLPEPESNKMATDKMATDKMATDKMATDKMATQNNPPYVSYMSSWVDTAPANIVQETPEGLLAACAKILGLAPGQDGASQSQPSWPVGRQSRLGPRELKSRVTE
jgi:hypothetical protein